MDGTGNAPEWAAGERRRLQLRVAALLVLLLAMLGILAVGALTGNRTSAISLVPFAVGVVALALNVRRLRQPELTAGGVPAVEAWRAAAVDLVPPGAGTLLGLAVYWAATPVAGLVAAPVVALAAFLVVRASRGGREFGIYRDWRGVTVMALSVFATLVVFRILSGP